MFEVSVTYVSEECDKLLCESEPSYTVKGGCLVVDGGKGQKLIISLDKLMVLKVKHPLPDRVPAFTYAANINYDTKEENVELLFSYRTVDISVLEQDGYPPCVLVKEGDDVVRVINSDYLRSIKVNSYTEETN